MRRDLAIAGLALLLARPAYALDKYDLWGLNTFYVDRVTGEMFTQGLRVSVGKAWEDLTLRAGIFPVFKSATASGGTATFHLTTDGLSNGAALCAGTIAGSTRVTISDAAELYTTAWAYSNGNKTVTATVNKASSSFVQLLGLTVLGSVTPAADGLPVYMSVMCY